MTLEHSTRRPLKTRERAWAKRTAQSLARAGFRPNQISILSMVFAALACLAMVGAGLVPHAGRGALFLAAAACIQFRLLCNLFDGMVAVEGGFQTRSGEIYNELPDRFSDALVLIGAAYAWPAPESFHVLGWMAALLSVITAYVRALGTSAGASPRFEGPMAKPHRMALLTGACVAMAVLVFAGKPMNLAHPSLAVVIAGCLLTILRRTRRILRELESA